jgi:antitoxin component YwqK of YwqJK toxin-antitoxin module
MTEPHRVSITDMDVNPATLQYLFDGKPFTGEMYEGSRERPKAVSEFHNGVRHGVSRVFYPDGALYSEARYVHNRPVGVDRTWHHNGQLREEITYTDDGTWVSTRRWSEDGQLIYTDTPDEGPSSLRR